MDLAKLMEQIDRQELTDFLQKAVQIPSHIELESQEKEIGQYIAGKLLAEGIETVLQVVEGERANVLATIHGTGEGKSVTFNGHIDVYKRQIQRLSYRWSSRRRIRLCS